MAGDQESVVGTDSSYWPVILTFLNVYSIIPCTFNKLPAVATIFKSGSTKGISLTAMLLETYCFSVILIYNFMKGYSLALYGEYVLVLIQEMVLISVMLSYRDLLNVKSLAIAALSFTAFVVSGSGLVPIGILSITMVKE
ncbi:uncharacterized protein LOC117118267 [Anneissia japonica]|uniref:uncharacterized protein LOC117118267 n=1 Tax=Anneissia japonica TaxID=1529436 RepID=UPI0014256071|nr:uncharacterized protein LOC117118267 [Anneissia japonica]